MVVVLRGIVFLILLLGVVVALEDANIGDEDSFEDDDDDDFDPLDAELAEGKAAGTIRLDYELPPKEDRDNPKVLREWMIKYGSENNTEQLRVLKEYEDILAELDALEELSNRWTHCMDKKVRRRRSVECYRIWKQLKKDERYGGKNAKTRAAYKKRHPDRITAAYEKIGRDLVRERERALEENEIFKLSDEPIDRANRALQYSMKEIKILLDSFGEHIEMTYDSELIKLWEETKYSILDEQAVLRDGKDDNWKRGPIEGPEACARGSRKCDDSKKQV